MGQEKPRTYKTGSALRVISRNSKPELANAHGHEFTAPNAPEGSTPRPPPAVAKFGQGRIKEINILRSRPECV